MTVRRLNQGGSPHHAASAAMSIGRLPCLCSPAFLNELDPQSIEGDGTFLYSKRATCQVGHKTVVPATWAATPSRHARTLSVKTARLIVALQYTVH